MKVDKTIELGSGHKIEFGEASWDATKTSIRNRYPTKTGGFSPRSSSEMPLEDLKIIIKETMANGYLSNREMMEIVEAGLKEIKKGL